MVRYNSAPSPAMAAGVPSCCSQRRSVTPGSPTLGPSRTASRRGSNTGASWTTKRAENTSRRCAFIHAPTSDPCAASRDARCASASSAEMPRSGRPHTSASPCMVAMPTRRPVNNPGPEATANRSIAHAVRF